MTLDFDMEDIPEPKVRARADYYDFLYSTLGLQFKQALDAPRNLRKIAGRPKSAYNVNELDEVPDSSWFTNRNTKQALSLAGIRRGPNDGHGPDDGAWTVFRGKNEGITPGFLIRDRRGDVYQLKFDPPDYPEMATAAEIIASKLYHAAGYNVKENHVVVFDRQRLIVDAEAVFKDRSGRIRRMTGADLDSILAGVARRADGTFRAVAGKYLAGIAKGPFAFEGRRKDDPNDWIPHEHRRDLRGLRVLASWLNENDFREANTLDAYVRKDERRFLRHYLIDFGSSLGSDSIHPNIERVGQEYQLDGGEIAKSLFSFGFYRRPWKGRGHVEHPALGFFPSQTFDPGRWKPNYPVLPFENMTDADAFWGARLVMSFTDTQIRAAVEAGELTDSRAAALLTRILIERRDKIGRYWLGRTNPVDAFRIGRTSFGEPQLIFSDLEVERGYAERHHRQYQYSIREENRERTIASHHRTTDPVIPLAAILSQAREEGVFRLDIRSLKDGRPQGRDTLVYLLVRGSSVKVVGVDRSWN